MTSSARVGYRWSGFAPLCVGVVVGLVLGQLAGCKGGPTLLKPDDQVTIDRKLVEYPANTELKPYVSGLTAPVAMAWDADGSMLIAESGIGGREPRIFGFKADGSTFEIYPRAKSLPGLPFGLPGRGRFRMYEPIGGMAFAHGRVYVSHRDENGYGVITAFGYDGTHQTIVADLPAMGDYSVTDIAVGSNGRVYFGMGAATNSGVVGLDNMGWLRTHRNFSDRPASPLFLLGRRFDAPNPFAGIFGGTDLAVTGPFQPFGKSIETQIQPPRDGKPNAAIYSVDPNGGDLRVESHGIRYPVGLGFNEYGNLFFTNQGMKLRGTRPVQDDPDVMARMFAGQWYGWPDFTTNFQPIYDPKFVPVKSDLIIKSGYRDLAFLIDHDRSGLTPPNPNSNILAGEFRPLSGAAKFAFAPGSGPFARLREAGNIAIVALWGDRTPFDTSGQKLVGPVGYRVVMLNLDDRRVTDFIRNTEEGPSSRRKGSVLELERPVDVKFGPDGALYVMDFGRYRMRRGREDVPKGAGKIFKLVGMEQRP